MALVAAGDPVKSCKVLALSGGGSKGAYEAGVLYGLVNTDSDKSKYEYDVITGVSTGAINTALVALWEKGSEVEMVDYLSEMWQTTNAADVYTQWKPLGPVTGLFSKSGLLDTSPAIPYLNSVFAEF